jgi:hypothetical protein
VTRQHAFDQIKLAANHARTSARQSRANGTAKTSTISVALYSNNLVQNFGRDHIKGVEIILRDPPHHFEVWPQRQYTAATNVQRNLIIRFESLRPRENITLAILNAGVELPQVQSVKWNGGVAREVPMIPQQELSHWAMLSIRGLMLSGILFWAYVMIRLVFAAFE